MCIEDEDEKYRFKLLKKGICVVINKHTSFFKAAVFDEINEEYIGNEFFYLEEVTPNELSMVIPGAIFYIYAGIYDIPGMGRSRRSKIRFCK